MSVHGAHEPRFPRAGLYGPAGVGAPAIACCMHGMAAGYVILLRVGRCTDPQNGSGSPT